MMEHPSGTTAGDPGKADPRSTEELLTAALAGDSRAQAIVFARHEPALRRMILLRLDRRIQARMDVDDLLQEIFLEFTRAMPQREDYQKIPFHLWLRMIAGMKLQAIHRRHLGVAARDAAREIALVSGPLPVASSQSLAIQLLGKNTSPSQAALRQELKLRIQTALDQLDPIDREVLALRHFEELSNPDVARILNLTPAAASSRFLRALKKMRPLLEGYDAPPGNS